MFWDSLWELLKSEWLTLGLGVLSVIVAGLNLVWSRKLVPASLTRELTIMREDGRLEEVSIPLNVAVTKGPQMVRRAIEFEKSIGEVLNKYFLDGDVKEGWRSPSGYIYDYFVVFNEKKIAIEVKLGLRKKLVQELLHHSVKSGCDVVIIVVKGEVGQELRDNEYLPELNLWPDKTEVYIWPTSNVRDFLEKLKKIFPLKADD